MKYYPSLDGLRFFAVLLVLIHHWLPDDHALNVLPNGQMGVTAFFVLSGFLITNILFSNRLQIATGNTYVAKALKIFYIRRSLRIFPIYYLLILALYFYGYSTINQYPVYFFAYASNILFFLNQSMAGTVSHLWTLAVEEQFYLVWPWVMLAVPGKYLYSVILSFIGVSIVLQLTYGAHLPYFNLLSFTAFDSFGMGALLAYYRTFKSDEETSFLRITGLLFLVSISLIILNELRLVPVLITTRTSISLISCYLIGSLSSPREFKLKRIFSFKPFVYIGRISYGVYLYHPFVPAFMERIYSHLGLFNQTWFSGGMIFLTNFLATIMIASISWFVIEKPINWLKRYFTMPKAVLENSRLQ